MAHQFGSLPEDMDSLYWLLFPYEIPHTNVASFIPNWKSLEIGSGYCSGVRCLPHCMMYETLVQHQGGMNKNLKVIRYVSECDWTKICGKFI